MAIKGAIIGDIIGSQYEFRRPKDFDYKYTIEINNSNTPNTWKDKEI